MGALSPLLHKQFAPRFLVSHPYATANEGTVKVGSYINNSRYYHEEEFSEVVKKTQFRIPLHEVNYGE